MEEIYSVDSLNESQIFNIIPVILQDDNDFTCGRLIENLEKNVSREKINNFFVLIKNFFNS